MRILFATVRNRIGIKTFWVEDDKDYYMKIDNRTYHSEFKCKDREQFLKLFEDSLKYRRD